MTLYKWKGVDRQGKTLSGTENAINPKELKKRLRSKGILAKEVSMPSLLDKDISELI